jgi:hypothetical protein
VAATLEELPDGHHWLLQGHRVTQLTVDLSSVRLQTWTLQASAEVRLGAPFLLGRTDAPRHELDPAQPAGLAPLLALLGRAVEWLTITRQGVLTVGFGDGTTITAAPHPVYEAWEVQGGGALEGMSYGCEPGGGTPWRER